MHLVIISRAAPAARVAALEAIDTALAAAAFDQQVTLLLTGDGVWQAAAAQAPADAASVASKLSGLSWFEVEDLRVDAGALTERGLAAEDLIEAVTVTDDAAITELLATADAVVSYP